LQKRRSRKVQKQQKFSSFGKNSLSALIDSLESAISGLSLKESKTKWNNYYENNNYAQASFGQKEKLVGELLKETGAKFLWDIGANSGNFSRIAAKQGMFTLSLDNDLAVVEQNYRQIKRDNEHKILPLYQDITCPSPAIGWGNDERDSFLSRELPDCILALALIHHLAIGNNLPFSYVAGLFSKLAKHLIIEFVPKEDSQVQILLQQRLDIFPNYTQRGFEHEFEVFFTIKNRINIPGTKRTLYLMKTRGC
jgi:ribosomal protein L11 methylase PrmA